jgi:thymidylate synthase
MERKMIADELYKEALSHILAKGRVKENRTGIVTKSVSGYMFQYDMADGFPLLTTKKMAWKTIRVELEGFIKGITDKSWYKERGCNIWNEWCNPQTVPYGHDEATKEAMAAENDLGPVYGYQWRNWNGNYTDGYGNQDGFDQLAWAIDQVKNNPQNRRILVNAWNPEQLSQMALVPCHYSFQLLCNDGTLDLLWNQRSCDLFLGIPFNIASYALLLELIAKECGLKAGKLIGFWGDLHLYENHMTQVIEQLNRRPFAAPTLKLTSGSIFEWDHTKAILEGYECHPPIKAEVAI